SGNWASLARDSHGPDCRGSVQCLAQGACDGSDRSCKTRLPVVGRTRPIFLRAPTPRQIVVRARASFGIWIWGVEASLRSSRRTILPTTISSTDGKESMILEGAEAVCEPHDLLNRYVSLLDEPRLAWIETHRMVRRLGSGGQGVVFLCERRGADNF